MNPFWSPTVQRSVMMESPGLPQQAGRLWREAQAGGYGEALGGQRSPGRSMEEDIEGIRQRVLKGAEKDFRKELRKIRGETVDAASYHTASDQAEGCGGMEVAGEPVRSPGQPGGSGGVERHLAPPPVLLEVKVLGLEVPLVLTRSRCERVNCPPCLFQVRMELLYNLVTGWHWFNRS